MAVAGHHRGFALLTFMIVMIGLGAFGLSKMLDSSVQDKQQLSRDKTRQALLDAKQALFGQAVDFLVQNDPSKMGALPCPDVDGSLNLEGSQDPSCGVKGANSLGLFPFKSVGLGKLEDGNGQCLWYAVSAAYKNAPGFGLLNWDSNGMLTVENEQAVLKHGSNPQDFPVAVLIAPGAPLAGQNRSADPALPLCSGNYSWNHYLENGPNLDYSTYTPGDVGSIWGFLDASVKSVGTNVNFNDRVVFITRKELWDAIEKTGSLSTSQPSPIRELTKNLAECLASYGNMDANRTLVYPSRMVLADYSDREDYRDQSGRFSGRYPQDIRNSNIDSGMKLSNDDAKKFVMDPGAGTGYCESASSLNAALWENWKDQFFLVVADAFKPGTLIPYASRCSAGGGNCLNIDSRSNVAAIVFFAKRRTADQTRDMTGYSNDSLVSERASMWNEYLDGTNRHLYDGTSATDTFEVNDDDYAFCIIKDSGGLSAVEC